jgi:hypothetical protein
MFLIEESLGIAGYFLYVKLVETKMKLKVTKAVTEFFKNFKPWLIFSLFFTLLSKTIVTLS